MYYLVCEKHYGGEKVCLAAKVYSLTHASLLASLGASHGSSISTTSVIHGYLTTSVDFRVSSKYNNITLIWNTLKSIEMSINSKNPK